MFNTLAQNGTKKITNLKSEPSITLHGKGSDLTDEKMWQGRARRKMITQNRCLALIKIAEKRGDKKMEDALWNTYYCQNNITSSGDKVHGEYCKNRFCLVCSGIRKAKIINKYYPILKKWEAPFFLTLTIKSVTKGRLELRIKEMQKAFNTIIERYKKRNQRGKGIKLMGIKSMESNFNPKAKTYNLHYHIILPNLETSDTLMREWRLYWNDSKIVNKSGQRNKRVKDLTKQLIETIKYGSKTFTEPDVIKKSKQKVPPNIYVVALYNILCAMKGHRNFERFGFNLCNTDELKTSEPQIVSQFEKWEYEPKRLDWINTISDKPLTKYLPTSELLNLLANNIDTEME